MTLKNDLNIAAWINSHYISEINIYKQLSYFSTMCINKVKGIRKIFQRFLQIEKSFFGQYACLCGFQRLKKGGVKGYLPLQNL